MRLPRTSLAAIGLAAVCATGCYSSGGRGKDPVDDALYFPVGLGLTPSGKWLLVANSDFDLAYKSGTIQAMDLDAIAAEVADCEDPTKTCIASPAVGVDAKTFVKASVRIGAFASDLKVVDLYETASDTKVADVSRLLVPVRGDATLTYVDMRESAQGITLDCYDGAKPNEIGRDCDAKHRVGQVATADSRNLTLEGEPFAISTPGFWSCALPTGGSKCALEPARSGGIASVVHQVSGDVSVFHDVQIAGQPPALTYTLGSMPTAATAIAALDLGGDTASATTPFVPRFLVTNRSQSSLMLVSYLGDDGNPDRGALAASSAIAITPQATGYDTRGVVVDPPGVGENRPTRVFLASRSPASIVVGEIDPDGGQLHFYENFPLPIGPSRIVRSARVGADGVSRSRIYVASYDSAYVVAYDPDARRIGDVIKMGRGPYSIALDEARGYAYVSNFIDGTIQVIDVRPTISGQTNPNYERVVFTVGKPQGPRS